MKIGPIFAAVLLMGGTAGAAYWIKQPPKAPAAAQGGPGGSGGRRGAQASNVAPVSVAAVTQQTVPVYREGIGNVQSLNMVTVRAQVDGRLMGVEFTEGMDVKKGAVLARIDPATFKAQYDQAVAKKAQDQANLANAKLDLERYRALAKTNAGPKQQADQQAAQVAQIEAQVAADQAAIDNTKAILDYTTILSPLDGRVGLRQVDPGNIVRAGDANGIVSITQVTPIGVLFTLPQRDLAATAAALAKGAVTVEIPSADGKTVDATGTLQSIDNQIDVTTGTIKLKAQFANAELKLWPGQFVGVRVIVATMANVKVVPATAIRRGVDGASSYNFVYVVGEDGLAHIKKLAVPQQNETLAVVEGDIAVGQSVVTEGFTLLTDGKAVLPSGQGPGAIEGVPGAAPAKRGPSADGKGDGKGDGTRRRPDGAAAVPGGTLSVEPAAGAPPAGGNRERRRRDETSAATPPPPAAPAGGTRDARP